MKSLFLLPTGLCLGTLLLFAAGLRAGHGADRMLLRAKSPGDVDTVRLRDYSPGELAGAFRRSRRLNETDRAILRAAALYQLDPRLLVAVATRESGMDPAARGAAGEIGMFQIMPQTARHWAQVTQRPEPSESALFGVYLNAEISAWYLRRGLDAFAHREDPLPFALAHYNAGPTHAKSWERNTPRGGDFLPHIPFASTRAYVRAVMEMARAE